MVKKIGFFLIEGFALMSCASAVEPIRAANLLARKPLFDIGFYSLAGGFIQSSCGAGFQTLPLSKLQKPVEILFVVAGGDPFLLDNPLQTAALHDTAAQGIALGGISGGGVVLAEAGLMANRRFTVHWEHFESLQAQSEDFLLERRLYVLDRDRYTCAGGSAPLDMMHAIIGSHHGANLAQKVSDWFIHTRIRRPEDPQREHLRDKFGVRDRTLHLSVRTALELMENHLASPLAIPQIALLAGVSERQIHRRFMDEIGKSPKQVYLELRLSKADDLLTDTRLSLTEIALTCGFAGAAHFSATFKKKHGLSPRQFRTQFEEPH